MQINSRIGSIATILSFLGCLVVAMPARCQLMKEEAPELFVAIRVGPSTISKGFSGSIPVEVAEFRPASLQETERVNPLLPTTGFTWSFSHGFGQLLPAGRKIPCRVFTLGLPVAAAPGLKAKLRAAVPDAWRDDRFRSALDTMGVAVVGTKGQDLSSIFPVPFADLPPSVADQTKLLSLITVDTAVPAASPWRIDNIAPALARGLVTPYCVIDAAAGGAGVRGALPYRNQVTELQNWAASVASSVKYENLLNAAIKSLKDGRNDVFQFEPFLGEIRDASSCVLDLKSAVSSDQGFKPLYHEMVGLQQVAEVDGYALPNDVNGGLPIELRFSQLSMTSFIWLEANLVRQLLKGWRWKQILTQGEPIAGASELRQTVLRINEPLWEYITCKTVEGTLAPGFRQIANVETFDAIDMSILDDRTRRARTRVMAPEGAFDLLHDKEGGEVGDAFYPCTRDLIDHKLNRAILTAMDGSKTPNALTIELTNRIFFLVAGGFTRASRDVSPAGVLQALGLQSVWAGQPLTLEPDLVWLARATSGFGATPPATRALARPFNVMQETRLNQVLRDLVDFPGRQDPQRVESLGWVNPPLVAIPEEANRVQDSDRYVYLLCNESSPILRGLLTYARERYRGLVHALGWLDLAIDLDPVHWREAGWLDQKWDADHQGQAQDPAQRRAVEREYWYRRYDFDLAQVLNVLDAPDLAGGATRCLHVRRTADGVAAVDNQNAASVALAQAVQSVLGTIDRCEEENNRATVKSEYLDNMVTKTLVRPTELPDHMWRLLLKGPSGPQVPAGWARTRLRRFFDVIQRLHIPKVQVTIAP
ncbi:MAG: hypothetical protein HY815_26730 [Candidatus Riflebacteria bacterium]|nr:hypothetical protein [Candidatus Riflebacteria bacterium]